MTTNQRAALAAAFLALVSGVVGGSYVLIHPDGNNQHIVVDGGVIPANYSCIELDGLSTTAQARTLFGLDGDAGLVYAHMRIAADISDGGSVEPALPSGYIPLVTTEKIVPNANCTALYEAWLPGATAPFGCACAPALADGGFVASTCQYNDPDAGWVQGPSRQHFLAGTWTGNCVAKPCEEIGGVTTWPTGCGPQ